MKTIIAGCRHLTDYNLVVEAMEGCPWVDQITEVVSGKAPGIDTLGERWAKENGIPVTPFPANWKKHGRAAGPIRNGEMALYADALVAVWNGKSTGTRDMIAKARLKNLLWSVMEIDE